MWSYKRPGFELLLLGALQSQQCSSQFCDTLLYSEGVCVPAHSCVLSALSPQISRTLATAPALPPGQKHLLEFQAVGPSTLLKLVGFLYSGELEGHEERERQEVMSAAHQLGIGGLVEVVGIDGVEEREKLRVRERQTEEERSEDGWMEGEDTGVPLSMLQRKEERAGWREGHMRVEAVVQAEAQEDRRGTGWADGRVRGEEDKVSGEMELMVLGSRSQRETSLLLPAVALSDDVTPAPSQACNAPRYVTDTAPPALRSVAPASVCMLRLLAAGAARDKAADPSVGGADAVAGGADLVDPVVDPAIPLSHILLLSPLQIGYPSTPLFSLGGAVPSPCTPVYIPPPAPALSLLPSAPGSPVLPPEGPRADAPFPLRVQSESVCDGTGTGLGSVEGDAGEFRRFEDNIPGFISFFLNPGGPQEDTAREGVRWAGCGRGRKEEDPCRGKRKRERLSKPEGGRGRGGAAACRDGVRTRSGNAWRQGGQRERGGGVASGKRGRGWGMVGRRQPIRIRFRRQSGVKLWEVVKIVEEGGASRSRRRGGHRPRRGSEASMRQPAAAGLNKDSFPMKRQRGRPRLRPLPFPALPHHLFKALSTPPLSLHQSSPSLYPLLSTVGPCPALSSSPTPNFLHTLPLPFPAPPLGGEDSVELIEKLQGHNFLPPAISLETKGGYGNHENSYSCSHGGAWLGPGVAMATVLTETAPCFSAPLEPQTDTSRAIGSPTIPQPAGGELNDVLDHFLWTFDNLACLQSTGEGWNAKLGSGVNRPHAGEADHCSANPTTADPARSHQTRPDRTGRLWKSHQHHFMVGEESHPTPECAPPVGREGEKVEHLPSKPEQLTKPFRITHVPIGSHPLNSFPGQSGLQSSLPLPKWLSPFPVGLQFPVSSMNRTRTSHPSKGLQNPQHPFPLKKLQNQSNLTQESAGVCRREGPWPEKRGSSGKVWAEGKRRAVTRRQGQERKRAEGEKEGRRRGYLKRGVESFDQTEEEEQGSEVWRTRVKQVKLEGRSKCLPAEGNRDKAERVGGDGVDGRASKGTGGQVGPSSRAGAQKGVAMNKGDVDMRTTVCLVRLLSDSASEERPCRPGDYTEKQPRDCAQKPLGVCKGKLPRVCLHKMEDFTNRTADQLWRTVPGVGELTQEEENEEITQAQRKKRARRLPEGAREPGRGGVERRVEVMSEPNDPLGGRRKREGSAGAPRARLKAVHAKKAGYLGAGRGGGTELEEPRFEPEPEPELGGVSRRPMMKRAQNASVQNSTGPLMPSTFDKIRALLQRHRERTRESSGEGERRREVEHSAEENRGRQMNGRERTNGPREEAEDLVRRTDGNGQAEEETGGAKLKEQANERMEEGGVKDSGEQGVAERQPPLGDGGDMGEWGALVPSPGGQTDVLQSHYSPHYSPMANTLHLDISPDGKGVEEEKDREGMGKRRVASVELCGKKTLSASRHLSAPVLPPVPRRDTGGSMGSLEQEEEEEVDVDVLEGYSLAPLPLILMPETWGEGLSPTTSLEEEEQEIDVTGEETD